MAAGQRLLGALYNRQFVQWYIPCENGLALISKYQTKEETAQEGGEMADFLGGSALIV